jgi:nitroreductase
MSIHELLAERHSPLAFDPDRDLTVDQVTTLFEAARWAPSCFNDQPWRYLAWQRSADPDAHEVALNCLDEGNRIWAHRAPLLVSALADTKFRRGKDNRWGAYDTGAASLSLCLQATAMGLVTHQMGGFDAHAISTRFGAPDRYQPIAMIAVGYPGAVDLLDEKQAARQAQPRVREPLSEWLFIGRWGGAYPASGDME